MVFLHTVKISNSIDKGKKEIERGLRKYERYIYDDDGNIIERLCSRCKIYHPIKVYEKYNYCEKCTKELRKEKGNKGIFASKYILDDDGNLLQRVCSKCNEFKDVNEFNKNKNTKYGITNQCKECVRKDKESKGV